MNWIDFVMNYVSSADQKQRFARICHTCMTRWARVDKTCIDIAAKTCLQCWTSAAPFLLLSLFDAPFHNAPRPTYVCICIIHWFANAWPVWTLMWTHWTYFNIRLCCIGCQWSVCSKLWKASFDFSHFDPEPVLTVSYHAVPRLCHVINRYHEHAQCFVSPLHDQPIAWPANARNHYQQCNDHDDCKANRADVRYPMKHLQARLASIAAKAQTSLAALVHQLLSAAALTSHLTPQRGTVACRSTAPMTQKAL